MSILLKRMGVKNHYFFLALYDKSLLNVDPHSKDLTTEQRLRIAYECKINFWYFIREVVRVPVVGQESGTRFILNRGNLALYWSIMNDVDIGYIWGSSLDVGMFTKDSTLVQDNVARLKGIRDCLPKWMVTKSTADGERKEGLYYAALKNSYKTFTSANDENGAYKLGRKQS